MSPPPETYYSMLEERLPGHGQPTEELRKRGILLDGTTEDGDPRLLLQIFSDKAEEKGRRRSAERDRSAPGTPGVQAVLALGI